MDEVERERLVRENADLHALFDMQWERMGEATARWRAEDPDTRAWIMPDLGALLEWLMTEIDKARVAALTAGNDVDRATRRLLHTSQHNQCVIWVGGRIQDDVNELRGAVGLPGFGWNDAVPDEEVGRCSVHPTDCVGQHTHPAPCPVHTDRV